MYELTLQGEEHGEFRVLIAEGGVVLICKVGSPKLLEKKEEKSGQEALLRSGHLHSAWPQMPLRWVFV